jgi:hypothetical protein
MAGFDPAVLFRWVPWMPVVGDGDPKKGGCGVGILHSPELAPSSMGVEKNLPKTLLYVRIHYSSDQLPGRHAAESHPHSPLSLPELPDAQAAGILSIPK